MDHRNAKKRREKARQDGKIEFKQPRPRERGQKGTKMKTSFEIEDGKVIDPADTYTIRWEPHDDGVDSVFRVIGEDGETVGTLLECPESDEEIEDFDSDFSLACATHGIYWDGQDVSGDVLLSAM